MLNIIGTISLNVNVIGQHFMDFYFNLFYVNFSNLNAMDDQLISNLIPSLVSTIDNDMLVAIPFSNEVRTEMIVWIPWVLWGLMVIHINFLCFAWEVIGEEVCDVVCFFFRTCSIPLGLNSNFLILILKVENVNSLDSFCPIILCNFLFKIIDNIISGRLSLIASKIISPN